MNHFQLITYRYARWVFLHIKQLYIAWKIRQSGIPLNARLSIDESAFFLGIYPYLEGSGLVFYDIGASVGYVTSCMAKLPAVKQIYAFEPIFSAFERLQKRTAHYSHVSCFRLALGDQRNSAEIHVNKSITSSSLLRTLPSHEHEFPWTSEVGTETISIARLDDFVREQALLPPDIIKIDVQGFELHVLAGARQSISQAKYCILEMSFVPLFESAPLFDDINETMRMEGYRLVGFVGEVRGKSGRVLQMDGIFKNTRISMSS